MHPVTKKIDVNGQMRCKDVFLKYITRGDSIDMGHEVSKVFQPPLIPDQTIVACSFYASTDTNPRYITDPTCQCLGTFTFQLPPHTPGQTTLFEQTLIFCDTVIFFRSTHLGTGKILQTTLRY